MESNYKFNSILIIGIITFILFIVINSGWGSGAVVSGKVHNVSINYAVKNTAPHPIITVETEKNKSININVAPNTKINKGDTVELLKQERLLTSGSSYTFLKVVNKNLTSSSSGTDNP